MPERTNEERARDAMQACESYTLADLGDPNDLQATITDLLTDLLHLAQREGIDAYRISETAYMHFQSENTDTLTSR